MDIETRVTALLTQMTLEEKVGQMTQVEKNSLEPKDVTDYFIGSVLSGGGGYPPANTPAGWRRMVGDYQHAALSTRLSIPLIYGVDAVHGHNNLYNAVLYPHNIGLGCAGDPDLVYRIARATAREILACGATWNFSPTVAVPQDLRWGRTFEGYSQNTELVTALSRAYIDGMQAGGLDAPDTVLATAKHYLGDGGAAWGTSHTRFAIPAGCHFTSEDGMYDWFIDRGDTRCDEATLRRVHLPPYQAAVAAGVQVVMASFSSWNGVRMHAHHYLLTEVLKGELGFDGFIVSDWEAISLIYPDYYASVVAAINAGIDMNMVPMDYKPFIATLIGAVQRGDVPLSRIDDAVRRILRVKMRSGLFERPMPDEGFQAAVGCADHRTLAREAVARSLVLLKNEGSVLPLDSTTPLIYVGGQAADDIGMECGGWSIEWQGKLGACTVGTTLLEGIQAAVAPGSRVVFSPDGVTGYDAGMKAEVGIAVLAEIPYAEGFGDFADLSLTAEEITLLERMRAACQKLVVILISGRPRVITAQLPLMDALVAAWLPGTECDGVADVLFGDQPFTGRLSFPWLRDMSQVNAAEAQGEPLFPFGYRVE